MLEAPVLNGQHPGVEALVNLSRFGHAAHPANGGVAGDRVIVAAGCIVACATSRLRVTKFQRFLPHLDIRLRNTAADAKRSWFVSHARGASFRSLNLPIVMTRKMEHIFLASHDHLAIEPAMRRAELLALGAPDEFVEAVLSSRLATDLSNGAFWRTVWSFLVANAGLIDPAQIERANRLPPGD